MKKMEKGLISQSIPGSSHSSSEDHFSVWVSKLTECSMLSEHEIPTSDGGKRTM